MPRREVWHGFSKQISGPNLDLRFGISVIAPEFPTVALFAIQASKEQVRHFSGRRLGKNSRGFSLFLGLSCPGAWGRDRRAFRQGRNSVRCAPASPQ